MRHLPWGHADRQEFLRYRFPLAPNTTGGWPDMAADSENNHGLALARRFFAMIPHSDVLGLEAIATGGDFIIARLPYQPSLVGDPATGVVHGGVITTLVDQSSGASVLVTLDRPEAIATLDLRIDYLQAAEPEREILARAHCYKVTPNIAFVRCVVYQSTVDEVVATSMSTFMRASQPGPSLVEGAA